MPRRSAITNTPHRTYPRITVQVTPRAATPSLPPSACAARTSRSPRTVSVPPRAAMSRAGCSRRRKSVSDTTSGSRVARASRGDVGPVRRSVRDVAAVVLIAWLPLNRHGAPEESETAGATRSTIRRGDPVPKGADGYFHLGIDEAPGMPGHRARLDRRRGADLARPVGSFPAASRGLLLASVEVVRPGEQVAVFGADVQQSVGPTADGYAQRRIDSTQTGSSRLSRYHPSDRLHQR